MYVEAVDELEMASKFEIFGHGRLPDDGGNPPSMEAFDTSLVL
jgi:hypothetical protein